MIYGDSGIVRRNAKKSPEAVERLNFPHPLRKRRARGKRKNQRKRESKKKETIIQKKDNLLLS